MSLTPGSRLGPYEISAQIGGGGMGEVYRAHDSRLGRDLAIKVLPAAMATEPEMRERFGREARAIAALNHPNIVTIYSAEEADGVRFLTMELVEGEALDRLIPSGGLDIDRIISIGEAVAEALARAMSAAPCATRHGLPSARPSSSAARPPDRPGPTRGSGSPCCRSSNRARTPGWRAAAAMLAVALLAGYVPAHRASRMNPLTALRRD